jgi:hypothetical protein
VNKPLNERTNIYNLQHFFHYYDEEDLNSWESEESEIDQSVI